MSFFYTRTAIFLHWLVALGLVGTFAMGFYMHDMPLSPSKLQLYSWHKWAGVTLFFVILVRLGWRVAHTPPPLPEMMSAPMRFAAHAAHCVMYALMVAIPLTGWLMSSAQGFQVVWFGVAPLPDLLPKDAGLAELLKSVHMVLNYTLLALVVTHIGAALKHHYIDKDGVLASMLPMRAKRAPSRVSA